MIPGLVYRLRSTRVSRFLCWLGLHQPVTTWGNEMYLGGWCLRCEQPWMLPTEPRQ